jgi:hypothetical protein
VRAQHAEAVSMQSGKYQMRSMRLPVVNMSEDEIKAYELDPANKPKIDFTPTGMRAQLSTILSIFDRKPKHP